MVITEKHLYHVGWFLAAWLPPDRFLKAAACFILGAQLRRRLLDAPHQQPLCWPHGWVCSGRLELNSSVSVGFHPRWVPTEKGGKFSFYGKISLNSPVTSLSSLVVFFCIPYSPTLKQPEQIWLSPPGGTVKLLLGEDLLAPSQAHPVLDGAFESFPLLVC